MRLSKCPDVDVEESNKNNLNETKFEK